MRPAVHAERDATLEDGVGELLGRKLAALVGIVDLGCAVSGEGRFDDLHRVAGLHRDGDLVSQHPAAGTSTTAVRYTKPLAIGM